MHDEPRLPTRRPSEPVGFDPALLEVDEPTEDVLARVRAGLRGPDARPGAPSSD